MMARDDMVTIVKQAEFKVCIYGNIYLNQKYFRVELLLNIKQLGRDE